MPRIVIVIVVRISVEPEFEPLPGLGIPRALVGHTNPRVNDGINNAWIGVVTVAITAEDVVVRGNPLIVWQVGVILRTVVRDFQAIDVQALAGLQQSSCFEAPFDIVHVAIAC